MLGDDMDSATECVKFKEKNWKKKSEKIEKGENLKKMIML